MSIVTERNPVIPHWIITSEKQWASKIRLKTLELDTKVERRTVVPHIERLKKIKEGGTRKPLSRIQGKRGEERCSSPLLISASSPRTPLIRKPLLLTFPISSSSTPRLPIAWSKFHPVSSERHNSERSVLVRKLMLGGLLLSH